MQVRPRRLQAIALHEPVESTADLRRIDAEPGWQGSASPNSCSRPGKNGATSSLSLRRRPAGFTNRPRYSPSRLQRSEGRFHGRENSERAARQLPRDSTDTPTESDRRRSEQAACRNSFPPSIRRTPSAHSPVPGRYLPDTGSGLRQPTGRGVPVLRNSVLANRKRACPAGRLA